MNRCWAVTLAASLAVACSDRADPPVARAMVSMSTISVHWQERTPATLPPERIGHSLTYDPVRELTVVAGGRPVSDTGPSLSDTWVWNGNRWSMSGQSSSFGRRGFIRSAFDVVRGTTLTYGGIDRSPDMYLDGTLEFEGSGWVFAGTNSFGGRSSYGIAYDQRRDVTVVFGGHQTDWLSDIWELSGSNWTQKCTGNCGGEPHPAARANMVFAYDEAREVIVMFGGSDGERYYDDTWTWDGATWNEHHPIEAPTPRDASAAAYDPMTRRLYVFGGSSEAGELNDFWAWDGEQWEIVAESSTPSPRRDAALVWDTGRRRGVLYGGRNESQTIDFWELTLSGNTCDSDDECHSSVCEGHCVPVTAGAGGTGAGGSPGSGGTPSGGTNSGGGGASSGGEPSGVSGSPALGGTSGAGGSAGVAGAAGAEESGSGGVAGAAGSAGAAGAGPATRDDPDRKSFYACSMSGAGKSAAPLGLLVLVGAAGLARRRRALARSAPHNAGEP